MALDSAASPEPGTPQHLKDAMEKVKQQAEPASARFQPGFFGGFGGIGIGIGFASRTSAESVASPLRDAIKIAEEKDLVDSEVIDEARQLLSDIPSIIATKRLPKCAPAHTTTLI